MKTYEITFTGRRCGAIGAFHEIRAQVFADNPEAAALALYDRFEHVQQPTIKEVPSPFDSDTLVNRVQNTQEEHAAIRRAVAALRRELDLVASRHTNDNQNWHDDPDAEDWALFHCAPYVMFPRELRDAALLELVSRHLDVLNENESAEKERAR